VSVVRLRLEDQGEGWFWDGTSIDVDVLDEVRMHSRLFYRVAFAEAVEAREAGDQVEPKADSDGAGASCTGAWLSPRWVGHEVGREEDISALLWMVRDVGQATRPPRDVDYSARVKCRALG
jgi:hypothetical protein